MTNTTDDRTARFKEEIADMKLKTDRTRSDRVWQAVGALLMVGGIALAFGAYIASLNVTSTPGSNVDVLNSNSYLPLAIAGLAIAVTGGFVFLRYSLGRFLRFWLLRQIYEQQRVVASTAANDGAARVQYAEPSAGTP